MLKSIKIYFYILSLVFVIQCANNATENNSGTSTAPANLTIQGLFSKNCAVCHGENGSGTVSYANSNFRAKANITTANQNTLINSVTNGLNQMPSFKSKLSATEISNLVTYLISNIGEFDASKAYSNTCANCHGAKGQGGSAPALKAPARTKTALTAADINTKLTTGTMAQYVPLWTSDNKTTVANYIVNTLAP